MMADPDAHRQTRSVLALIGVTTAIRLLFAGATGLGMDESYMVAAGRIPALGYFDHPPAAWWLSWSAAHLFDTEAPIVVRLPFIALFALSTWLMYRLGLAAFDARAGFWAAVTLNLSPVFGVTTGTWVLPDGPLVCALLGAALCLTHAVDRPAARLWWAGAGLCAGLALAAKYSAVLTILGAFLFLATSPTHRRILGQHGPWIAALLAVLIFSPVLVWNAAHDWASFAFQGQRAAGPRFRPLAPFEVLAGGALFVLPWFWAPMLWLGCRAVVGKGDGGRLLAWLAAVPIMVFALVSAWSSHRVLYHWAAPGYLMLLPLLGRFIADRISRPWMRRLLATTAALVLAAIVIIGSQIRFDVLGPALTTLTRKDPTIEGVDWTSLRTALAARGLLDADTLIGLPNWRDGGKIAYGLGPDIAVTVLHADARQFGLTRPARDHLGRDMLVLTLDPPERATAALAPLFARWTPLGTVPITLRDRTLREAALFRAEHLTTAP